ncbi:MAG: hypothetical protein ABSF83_03815 [Nitrososphaerales archaeon]
MSGLGPAESPKEKTREGEWYVPRFGPRRFRLFVGMTFFPYTAMNASFAVIGSLLSPAPVNWGRVAAIAAVYLMAVGLSAHALDAMGPNKPWGQFMSRRQLSGLAISSLAAAAAIGLYYAITAAPLLFLVGLPEVFFLFAYNLELFGGLFHSRGWFCLSWGLLPVIAGYVIQTDAVGLPAVAAGIFGFGAAYAEITVSRSYKSIKRDPSPPRAELARRYESMLKGIVGSVVCVALALVLLRGF